MSNTSMSDVIGASKSPMDYFRHLGRRIEERWRAAGFDDRAFSVIAFDELERAPAHLRVSNADILDWCNRPGETLPPQLDIDSSFGDPPITVFRGHGMVIDVNFWFTSTTSVHEHGFDGAFQVLSGSSLHTQFDFVERRRYNAQTYEGDLAARPSEELLPGATRTIVSGPAFIHALFHLEGPSSTVVVRTLGNRLHKVQRYFLRCGLAFDGFNTHPSATKNRLALEQMCMAEHPRLDASLERYLREAGPREAYEMLNNVARAWGALPGATPDGLEARVVSYVAVVEESSSWGRLVAAAFREEWPMSTITGARATIQDPDRRWFLAVLLNVRSRAADVFGLVAKRFPDDDPIDRTFTLVEQLTGRDAPLGIVLNKSQLRVARGLAEGKTIEGIVAQLNTTRRTPATIQEIEQAARDLRASALRVLFSV